MDHGPDYCLTSLLLHSNMHAKLQQLLYVYTCVHMCQTGLSHIGKYFQIIVEYLANAIRKKTNIKGIKKINGIEFKVSQYADDTCLFLSDKKSLKAALDTITFFNTCSGLKINMDKSKAKWIGASSNYRHKPFGLKWTQDIFKTLGIYIGTDMQHMINKNFTEKLDKILN